MNKLAIISTHPIQYYAPVFKALNSEIHVHVFYTLGKVNNFDQGFGIDITWDIPLTEGYEHTFLTNDSKNKGTHHFWGIDNQDGIKKIEAFNPDALLVYGWANKSHLKIIRHFSKHKTIYFRGDSTLLNQEGFIKRTLRKAFLRWIYSHVDKAFFVGSRNYDYFIEYGLKDSQLIFAPHSIDNDRFEKAKAFSEIRNGLNIKDHEVVVLFAGKFTSTKNPFLLIEAFKNINSSNLHLLLVGNGDLEAQMRNLSIGYANIHYLPFQNQSQIPEIYAACDLFCLPSISETWGLAINEAMASGKALLTSDRVGCSIDLVRDNYNGKIFESNNLIDLQTKLMDLTSDKKRLTEMGKNSQHLIKNYHFNNQVNAMLKEFIKK